MDCCIRVDGHLDCAWQGWFAPLALRHEAAGTTLLTGALPDQAALYGVLLKINRLGVALPSATGRRALTLTLWVVQLLVAVQFIAGGYLKLSGAPVMVEMFATIGAGQWLRIVVGALEIAGAVGLVIPRLSGLAALGLAGLLVGATATNMLVLGASLWLPLGLLLLCALIAWGRRHQIATRAGMRQHGPGARRV